jgi:hypothetical protein
VVEATYYQRRSALQPGWREEQVAAASERYQRAKNADPERVLGYSRAYRERLRESPRPRDEGRAP